MAIAQLHPLRMTKPSRYTYGPGQSSDHVARDNASALLNLFFDKVTLKVLVRYANGYANVYRRGSRRGKEDSVMGIRNQNDPQLRGFLW